MASRGGDPAVFKDDYPVGFQDGADALCDDQGRVRKVQLPDGVLDFTLGFDVYRAGAVIQDQ